jgi:predicted transcriptional regulator
MSRGSGSWQRAALALLNEELQFGQIAEKLDAVTSSQRSALRRALDRLVAVGQLGKRPGKRMYGGPRDIVWFRLK